MYYTTDITEFVEKNHRECRLLFIHHYGYRTEADIEDGLQKFYFRLLRTDSLKKWQPGMGCTYETYLCNLMVWSQKKKDKKVKPVFVRRLEFCIDTSQYRDVSERIKEFREYIIKHASKDMKERVLSILNNKIKGLGVTEDIEAYTEYRFLLKNYLAAGG